MFRRLYVQTRLIAFRRLSVQKLISAECAAAFRRAYPNDTVPVTVGVAATNIQADYQTNAPFLVLKSLQARGEKAKPVDIASTVVAALSTSTVFAAKFSPPGFINCTVHDSTLARLVEQIAQDPTCLRPRVTTPRRVLVDYASPNMGKELHAGHLRSIVLGETLSRLFEYVGHDVQRVSHVGDWGTPMGMMLTYCLQNQLPFTTENDTNLPTGEELSAWYVKAKQRFDEDAAFRAATHDTVAALQKGDEQIRRVWSQLCAASRVGFDDIYRRLNVTITERGESTYAPHVSAVLQQLTEKGLTVERDNVLTVPTPGFAAPLIVQKSNGAHLYATTDLTALHTRLAEGVQTIVYITDKTQIQHFQQIFATGKAAGWVTPDIHLHHLTFGLVLDEFNRKLSSRSGGSLSLRALLDQAEAAAANHAQSQTADASIVRSIAQPLGYGALRFYDLVHPGDYPLNFAHIFNFKGSTSIYVLYALTRLRSLQKIASARSGANASSSGSGEVVLGVAQERDLALHLVRFSDVVERAVAELQPSIVCEYLVQVGQKLNVFYESCRVLDSEEQSSRLTLCCAAQNVLEEGLRLLNIPIVERM